MRIYIKILRHPTRYFFTTFWNLKRQLKGKHLDTGLDTGLDIKPGIQTGAEGQHPWDTHWHRLDIKSGTQTGAERQDQYRATIWKPQFKPVQATKTRI